MQRNVYKNDSECRLLQKTMHLAKLTFGIAYFSPFQLFLYSKGSLKITGVLDMS